MGDGGAFCHDLRRRKGNGGARATVPSASLRLPRPNPYASTSTSSSTSHYLAPMILHPWHEVAHRFDAAAATVDALIEIPRGSKAKYEVDKPSGLIRLDRVVFAAFQYPSNYGFIPQTLGEDGDPLDILVLSEVSMVPLTLVKTRIIGYMEMIDNGDCDEKVIAVAEGDMSVSHIRDMELLPENFRSELKHFFMNYKTLSNKVVTVDEFKSTAEATALVQQCIERYQSKFA